MFRISKVFENESTHLYRVEGKITDDILADWIKELDSLKSRNGQHVILDLCQVWYISTGAVEALLNHVTDNFFLLNCGMEVRNIFHAVGLSSRMLE